MNYFLYQPRINLIVDVFNEDCRQPMAMGGFLQKPSIRVIQEN